MLNDSKKKICLLVLFRLILDNGAGAFLSHCAPRGVCVARKHLHRLWDLDGVFVVSRALSCSRKYKNQKHVAQKI